MPSKILKKLKKKKGKLSRKLNKSRSLEISKNIITVYVADDFYKKNGTNGEDKKDKKIKKDISKQYKDKRDKKTKKLIDKINTFKKKNKRIDNLIGKLMLRRTKLR